ncbi:hypothetical protein HN51_069058 [Arachis hypogaea]
MIQLLKNNIRRNVWENSCLIRCELPIKFPVYYPLKNTSDTIQVSVLFNCLEPLSASAVPVAEYIPIELLPSAQNEVRLLVVDIKLDVLCYASKKLPLRHAVSRLIIPGLADQLNVLQNSMLPNLLRQHPQVRQCIHILVNGLIKEAIHVIGCGYEEKTKWGKEMRLKRFIHIGWIYRSVTKDILTGFKMHCRGWRSIYCIPLRPAFKGSAPINLSDRLHQVLRWALGSVEVFFSRHCPLWYGFAGGRLRWLQRLAYINTIVYPFTSLPLVAYCSLPAICLLSEKFVIPTGCGCAYRSLQTIISWFRLQNYSSIEVPSHRFTANLINGFHTPEGAELDKKQVSKLGRFFSISFLWSFFQWFLTAGDDCGFSSFPTFGLQAYKNKFYFDFSATYVGVGMICLYNQCIPADWWNSLMGCHVATHC